MIDFTTKLPEMKSGNELISALSIIPEYDETICQQNQAARLMALSDLYQIYIPSQMSLEIYSKLYLALLRSMQKKGTQMAIKQRYENYRAIQQQSYSGILGGSDSFTIIGTSGIGKSSAISRAISLITENRIIETDKPYTKIIPCLIVQCPFDSSVKGMLLEILRKVDEELGTDHYNHAIKSRAATTDMLIGSVSSVALNHIGMLVVDEIQNVVNSKNGKSLIGALTQLINNSGVSICMVGTPESTLFFEQAMQLARRSVGLQYTTMKYDEYFQSFCKIIFKYQFLKNQTEITAAITEWLYEHSAGVVSVVVSLIHDAQEIAILTGKEVLNLDTLNEAYQQRLTLLHGYIQPSVIQNKPTTKKKKTASSIKKNQTQSQPKQEGYSITEIAEKAKAENLDVVELLKEVYTIVEVSV
nr:TniB family NTP-binding protein [uncultured Blautia sp.]